MEQPSPAPIRYEGIHAAVEISRPAPGVVLAVFEGRDVGELGDAPFRELAIDVRSAPVELFIDARRSQGASIDVSGEWATWLTHHRGALRRINMLTGSRFIQMTADFVRRAAQLEERMRIYTDAAAFDEALAAATAEHGSERPQESSRAS